VAPDRLRAARRLAYRLAGQLRRGYWFVIRPRTAGVKCVIVHDGRWLMIRNTYGHRQWTFPGGGVRRGEPVEAAVRREVAEEVGIDLGAVRPIGSYYSTRNRCRDTVTCFVADVESAGAVADGVEVAEVSWVDPDRLPVPLSPAVDDVLALLHES
jgi:8-oxo-dGTP pyrophosphatase MutT (NUDIX family)